MGKRRRVTYGQSFREMRDARRKTPSAGTEGDILMALLLVPLAAWYWVVGVPENGSTGGEPDDVTDEAVEPEWERRDREIWADDEP